MWSSAQRRWAAVRRRWWAAAGSNRRPSESSGSSTTDGGTQQFGYYADDLLAVQVGRNPSGDTSASGRITSSYDLAGDTTSTADSTYTNAATSTAVRSSYYLDGLVHQVTDGKQDTTYTYNGIGEITGRTDKNTVTAGATGTTGTAGNNSSYSYNPAGLLLSAYATGHQGTWTFGYDQLGRQTGWTQPSDPKSQITGARSFNADDTLAEQKLTVQPLDASGNPTGSVQNRADWAYDYDALSRILDQTLSGDTGTSAAPGSATATDSTNKALGAVATGRYAYCYDVAGRISTVDDTATTTGADGSAQSSPRSRVVRYDSDGNRIAYGLTGEAGTDSTASNSSVCNRSVNTVCERYQADDSLAQTTGVDGSTLNVSTDADGRQADDGCRSVTYDGFDRTAGNTSHAPSTACGTQSTTTVRQGASSAATTTTTTSSSTSAQTYAYDALDRQRDAATSGTASSSSTVQPAPTASGVQAPVGPAVTTTTTSSGDVTTDYAGRSSSELDQETKSTSEAKTGAVPVAGVAAMDNTTTSDTPLSYVSTPGGAPLAEFSTTTTQTTGTTPVASASTSAAGWLTDDGNGNIATVTKYDGSTACQTRYDPNGVPERQQVANPSGTSSYDVGTGNAPPSDFDPQGVCSSGTSTNQRWYTGTHRDMATGDYTFGARVYDPTKAAFTSSDSYRDGGVSADVGLLLDSATANTYSYVNGDPLNATDGNGHEALPDHWCSPYCNPLHDTERLYHHAEVDLHHDVWDPVGRCGACNDVGDAWASAVNAWASAMDYTRHALVGHRGLVTTLGAASICAASLGAGCAISVAVALAFRVQQRGVTQTKANLEDAAVSAAALGLGSLIEEGLAGAEEAGLPEAPITAGGKRLLRAQSVAVDAT